MAVRVGSAIFEDHVSIEIAPNNWTDTFILPIHYDRGLPPWDYAEVVKTVMPTLKELRRSASLWVPVMAPESWYFEEVKFALHLSSFPIAVTDGRNLPGLLDFCRLPGVYYSPCHGGAPVDLSLIADLSAHAVRCLLTMARLVAAYTNEVASTCLIEDRACRNALWELEKQGYVKYHENDNNIDSHLSMVRQRVSQKEKNAQEVWPYWTIRRPGLSVALRVWGVPAGADFRYRTERNRLLDSIHRRRSRQWPKGS